MPGNGSARLPAMASTRQSFQQQLDAVEEELQNHGRLVLRALDRSVQALLAGDEQLADRVIAGDDENDASYLKIEDEVERLLALQTPLATDLRLILTILHVNLHLERMADYCVTIAKLTKLASGLAPDAALVEGFQEMGARAEEMIRVALDSFARRDLAGAEGLVELDELIDRANRRVVQNVLDLGADPALREWGLRMMIVSRALERLGDHAVDIGEQTAYLVTGELREFSDASR